MATKSWPQNDAQTNEGEAFNESNPEPKKGGRALPLAL